MLVDSREVWKGFSALPRQMARTIGSSASICTASALLTLFCWRNFIRRLVLTKGAGKIPNTVGLLRQLQTLDLSQCGLQGSCSFDEIYRSWILQPINDVFALHGVATQFGNHVALSYLHAATTVDWQQLFRWPSRLYFARLRLLSFFFFAPCLPCRVRC